VPGRHSRSLGRRSGRRRITSFWVSTTPPHRPRRRQPTGRRAPMSRRGRRRPDRPPGEAVESDHGWAARSAVPTDRDDHELRLPCLNVRGTDRSAEEQPRSVWRPRGTGIVGGRRTSDLKPSRVLEVRPERCAADRILVDELADGSGRGECIRPRSTLSAVVMTRESFERPSERSMTRVASGWNRALVGVDGADNS
jgi:hypothetical protein